MATVTRQSLRTRIGRDEAWMRFSPVAPDTASGTTTASGAADGSTIVDSGIYSSAIDQLVRQRSVICITSHPAVTVASSSVADPTVITTASPHGFATGDSVTIAGHSGSNDDAAVNATHSITFISATTFSIPVDLTGGGGTGGTATAVAGRRGERSYATGPPDSSGVITVSPPFSAQTIAGMTYEIWDPDGPHPDLVDRFIDKSLQENCWRWVPTPITLLRGGDVAEDLAVLADDLLQDGTVVWTGDGDVTLTLEDQSVPEEFVRRVIRILATAGDGGIESNPIDCDPVSRGEWRIEVLCRSMDSIAGAAGGSGNGTEIKLMDKTNSVEITPTTTLSTVNRGWTLLASDFTLPETCYQIAIQLNVETSGELGEFAWIQLWPRNHKRISLPQRIVAKNHVGGTFVRVGDIFDNFARAPWLGALDRREVGGTGVQILLDPALGDSALWFYERDSFPALTTSTPAATDDDATTWAADVWVRAAVAWECYRWLQNRDRKSAQGTPEGPDARPARGWERAEADALAILLAMQEEYGAEPMLVEDAATPAHRATQEIH